MEITFYGSGKEVGRSCINLRVKEYNILLDAGIKLSEKIEYPTIEESDLRRFLKSLNYIFISHAHLDHTGALPLYHYYGLKKKIFSTSMTRRITKILLKDSYKIECLSNKHIAYEKRDVKAIINQFSDIEYFTPYNFRGVEIMFFDAGHIPGSASIKLNIKGKRILYTGDINLVETNLLYPANINYGHVDIMICESTYGNRNHEPREKEETRFINDITRTIEQGKTALVAAFSVGRSQEILLMLYKHIKEIYKRIKVPIIIDGMGTKVCEEFLREPRFLKEPKELERIFRKIRKIRNRREREIIIKNKRPKIIISSAGMCSGGTIITYLKRYYNNKNVNLFLTGWQAEHTNGRMLMEERKLWIDGWKKVFLGDVNHYDFSAHSGLDDLIYLIKKVKPSVLLINHGDREVSEYMAKIVKEKIKIDNIISVENNKRYVIKD